MCLVRQNCENVFSQQNTRKWIDFGRVWLIKHDYLFIFQASILKIYQEDQMMIVCLYCFLVTIISALVSLVVERNTNAWMIYPDIRLVAILYSVRIKINSQYSFSFIGEKIKKSISNQKSLKLILSRPRLHG